MQTRTAPSGTVEVVEEEVEDGAEEEDEEPQQRVERLSNQKLHFHEPLTWRAGNPIAVGDLLRRLQSLAKELRDIDQDGADRNSLTRPAKELATQNLLAHKDKGVRAWTAICLVDILRLCAPEAPFTETQLKVDSGSMMFKEHTKG